MVASPAAQALFTGEHSAASAPRTAPLATAGLLDRDYTLRSFLGACHVKKVAFLLALIAMTLDANAQAQDRPARYSRRWFYAPHNLLVDKGVEELLSLMRRAHQSGYNGVLLADDKLAILDQVPETYFAHAQRILKAAREYQMEIIPAIFPIGYSGRLLAHDPNLAEGLPAVDIPFVVRGRQAVLVPEPSARIANGDLEQVQDNRFSGFMLQDDPGKRTFADHRVVHGGHTSLRIEDTAKGIPNRNYRLAQHVRVRPHACYRFSAWVKTRALQPVGGFQLFARSAGLAHRMLSFYEPQLSSTQDWTQVEVVFNTLDENAIELYIGHWGAQSGTMWIDDLALEELALVNVLRREGCPLVIRSDDGKTTYEEGKDYEPIRDPHLGQHPFAGEYEFRHVGPPLRLTAESRITDGQRLKVSWYHPIITRGFQVTCCLSERALFDLLQDQARRVNDLFKPNTFFMLHDEIRVANWCRSCQKKNVSAGQLLADNVAQCIRILRQTNPAAKIVVWSDMFDPNHNAIEHPDLVRGSLAGSWKGLTSDVIIANWNQDRAAESLKWFAALGHPQIIAGYYDSTIENFKKWDAAARGMPKIEGFLYTTWEGKYELLEEYGKALSGK
jgi:hypothetical protein